MNAPLSTEARLRLLELSTDGPIPADERAEILHGPGYPAALRARQDARAMAAWVETAAEALRRVYAMAPGEARKAWQPRAEAGLFQALRAHIAAGRRVEETTAPERQRRVA